MASNGGNVAGKLVLAGGDEFRPGCEDMDKVILESTASPSARVLIVPTAAAFQNPDKAASNGVSYFSSLGALSSELMVLDRSHADDDEYASAISGADIVYFTGGNPDHLLATLKGTKLLATLRDALDKGATVGGSSAGAMVMGSSMIQPSTRTWVDGLRLAQGVGVLPHHEDGDPARVASQLADAVPSDLTVLGIDGMTCCFGLPGSWTVLGSGKVTAYRNGRWETFTSGEKLPQEI